MDRRLPRVTAEQALRALAQDGWEQLSQSGSHVKLGHPTKPGRVIVPRHKGRDLATGLTADIIKQAGLTVDEFAELLQRSMVNGAFDLHGSPRAGCRIGWI